MENPKIEAVSPEAFEVLEAKNAALETIVNDLLTAQTTGSSIAFGSKTETPVLPEPFEFGGKKYEFIVPIFLTATNETVTATDAVQDTELIGELIKSKSGLIRLVS